MTVADPLLVDNPCPACGRLMQKPAYLPSVEGLPGQVVCQKCVSTPCSDKRVLLAIRHRLAHRLANPSPQIAIRPTVIGGESQGGDSPELQKWKRQERRRRQRDRHRLRHARLDRHGWRRVVRLALWVGVLGTAAIACCLWNETFGKDF